MVSLLRNCLLGGILLFAGSVVFANPNHTRRPAKSAASAEKATAGAEKTATNTDATKPYRIVSLEKEGKAAPLEGMLLTSIQYAVQDMYFYSPPQFPPQLNTTTRIYEGQWIMPVPVVGSYAVSNEGQIDVRYALDVIEPSGEIEQGPQDNVLFAGQAHEKPVLLFPTGGLGLFYTGENQGPGTYTLRVSVHDRISDEKLLLEQAIEVSPYTVPPFPEDAEPDAWLSNYYRSPQPGFALPALTAMMQDVGNDRIDSITASMLGFYNRLLTDNRWLLPYFSKQLEEALDRAQNGGQISTADIMLGLVVSFHLRSLETRPESVSERIWLETETNRQFDWSYLEPSGEYIHYPQQLDYLWGQFFASGSYQPIHRLLEALFQDQEAAAATAPESLAGLRSEQREALREAVHKATQWSLASNARQHRLVMGYLVGTLINNEETLSEQNRKQLQFVLALAIHSGKEEQGENAEGDAQQSQPAKPAPQAGADATAKEPERATAP